MKQLTDKALLLQLKEGNNVALRCLFQKYYQRLFLFACKFAKEDVAKDLVQDCFLELWKNRKKTEITSSLSGYLFTTIKNRCYKYLKEEQKKTSHQQNFGLKLKEEEFNFFLNSEKSILEFDVKDRIEKVLAQLPEKCGLVFNASRFNGLSNKEIAEKYEISLKAVEKHISKALKMFREEFKDLLILLILFFIRHIF